MSWSLYQFSDNYSRNNDPEFSSVQSLGSIPQVKFSQRNSCQNRIPPFFLDSIWVLSHNGKLSQVKFSNHRPYIDKTPCKIPSMDLLPRSSSTPPFFLTWASGIRDIVDFQHISILLTVNRAETSNIQLLDKFLNLHNFYNLFYIIISYTLRVIISPILLFQSIGLKEPRASAGKKVISPK